MGGMLGRAVRPGIGARHVRAPVEDRPGAPARLRGSTDAPAWRTGEPCRRHGYRFARGRRRALSPSGSTSVDAGWPRRRRRGRRRTHRAGGGVGVGSRCGSPRHRAARHRWLGSCTPAPRQRLPRHRHPHLGSRRRLRVTGRGGRGGGLHTEGRACLGQDPSHRRSFTVRINATGRERARGLHLALLQLALAALTLAVVEIAILYAGSLEPEWLSLLFPAGAAVYFGFGLLAWLRRAGHRFGALLNAGGLTLLMVGLANADEPGLAAAGQIVATVPLAIVIHMLLAFPSG